jgi:serine protease Do
MRYSFSLLIDVPHNLGYEGGHAVKSKFVFSCKRTFASPIYALICISFLFLASPCTAVQPDGLGILRETSKAFASLAKKTTPAVVFIETSLDSSKSTKEKTPFGESPLEFFNDDFFNHFFGSPFTEKPKAKKERAFGSGFIVSEDGYILTNNHLVKNAEVVTVTMQGERKFPAKIVGVDPKTDIAVIKIDMKNLPYVALGDSSSLEVGEWVMAIGNPFGLEASVTVGVVSAKGRSQLHLTDFEDFIQTDAAINPGNSGGPLLNMDGQVIGMNTAIVSPNGGGYIGIGFAVPSNMIMPIMNQLIKTGKVTRGFLGVALQQVDSDLASSFGLSTPDGALISEITKGSPAETAGLKSGDVILKYNNLPVANISQFRNSVSLMSPGTNLSLSVYRDGKMILIPIQVGTQSEKLEKQKQTIPSEQLGLVVEELTNELAKRYGSESDRGIIVTKVLSGSLGEQAGIKPGAQIIAIDRNKITSIDDFNKGVAKAMESKRILLLVKQGGATRYVALKF